MKTNRNLEWVADDGSPQKLNKLPTTEGFVYSEGSGNYNTMEIPEPLQPKVIWSGSIGAQQSSITANLGGGTVSTLGYKSKFHIPEVARQFVNPKNIIIFEFTYGFVIYTPYMGAVYLGGPWLTHQTTYANPGDPKNQSAFIFPVYMRYEGEDESDIWLDILPVSTVLTHTDTPGPSNQNPMTSRSIGTESPLSSEQLIRITAIPLTK